MPFCWYWEELCLLGVSMLLNLLELVQSLVSEMMEAG